MKVTTTHYIVVALFATSCGMEKSRLENTESSLQDSLAKLKKDSLAEIGRLHDQRMATEPRYRDSVNKFKSDSLLHDRKERPDNHVSYTEHWSSTRNMYRVAVEVKNNSLRTMSNPEFEATIVSTEDVPSKSVTFTYQCTLKPGETFVGESQHVGRVFSLSTKYLNFVRATWSP